jgi:hypothetical protein
MLLFLLKEFLLWDVLGPLYFWNSERKLSRCGCTLALENALLWHPDRKQTCSSLLRCLVPSPLYFLLSTFEASVSFFEHQDDIIFRLSGLVLHLHRCSRSLKISNAGKRIENSVYRFYLEVRISTWFLLRSFTVVYICGFRVYHKHSVT